MPTLTPEEAMELQRAADSIATERAAKGIKRYTIGGKRTGAGRKSPVPGGTVSIYVSKEAGMRIRSAARRTGRTHAQVVDARDW